MTPQGPTADPAIEDRLAFESVLAEVSSRFVNLPPDRVDREIEAAQRQVCECLDLDLSSLWQWTKDDPYSLTLTHLYRPLGGPPVPEKMDAASHFPWSQSRLMQGRVVAVSSLEGLPQEAARDRVTWQHFGIRTSLGIPLAVGGGEAIGVLSFNTMREERSWPEAIVQRLTLVAEVFTNALARRDSEAALCESEQRLQLAAEAAGVGTWMLDLASGRFWANDRGRRIFGYEPDSDITMERFLASVHPECCDQVAEAVRRAVEEGRELDFEYRIVRADGSERWIQSRGMAQSDSPDDAACVMGVSVDVTDRKRLELEQIDQLRFERLLADLSTKFVNLRTSELDAAIEDAQRRVCEFLGIELCALWQWSPEDSGDQTLTHLYRPQGGPAIPVRMDAREHVPWSLEQMVHGRSVVLPSIDDAPPEAARSKETWQRFGIKATLILPLVIGGGRPIGSLSFNDLKEERAWPELLVQRLRLVAEIFTNALERKQSEERIQRSLLEIEELKQRLELENAYLRQEYRLQHGQGRIVGESPAIMKVLNLVEQVAPTRSTVLIEGETGTGKELVAQRLHELSPRHDRPMVKVNCAALPSSLVESELFGREKGAYTGAVSQESGRFEIADGSTLFLDELAELALELQAKLLRVLEEGQYERVGSSRTLTTDARLIAATNRDLEAEVDAGRFRRDLYFRLAVFPIVVPPLRKRRGDVPLLVWAIVHELSSAMNKSVETIPREDMERLQQYDWPGNVRELRNVIERALILCSGPLLHIEPPTGPPARGPDEDVLLSMDEAQRRHIQRALEAAGGRIRGVGGAAELLGMKATTLRSRMDRLGIDPHQLRNETKAT